MKLFGIPSSFRFWGAAAWVAGFLLGSAIPSHLFAQEASKSFWQRHGKVEDEETAPRFESTPKEPSRQIKPPDSPIPLTLDNLRIPLEYGSIRTTYTAKEPIIIHIQDAHANYTAQKNLASMLEHLILWHGLSLVLVEGGSRNDSLSYMRSYAPLERRRQVAEEFLQAGKISGENYLDLTSDYPFTVYGIEKPELYDENMEAYLAAEQIQPKARLAIRNFLDAAESLKQKIYPDPVRQLEAREWEVEEGRIPLAQHYQALAQEATERKIPLTQKDHPNLLAFLKASQLEKELDFKAVERERTRFLEELLKGPNPALPKGEMDKLLQQSLELKQGLITPAAFYGHLKSYLKPEEAPKYPALVKYIEYLKLFDSIDHAALFTEVDRVAERVKESHFTRQNQRQLARIAKDVKVLADLIELKLTPDSYDYYSTHTDEFKPDRWAKDLRSLATAQDPKWALALDPGTLNAAIPVLARFYEVARKRDMAMVENALTRIKEFNVPFAVLIAGGFHTPILERLFREQKISYAVVAPKVGKVTAQDIEKYHRVLKETYVPMSEKYRQKLGIQTGTMQTTSAQQPQRSQAQAQGQATALNEEKMRPAAYPEARVALANKKEEDWE
jgi:hypothetical protein